MLADRRVDPNVAEGDGYTPLLYAAARRDVSLLELLLADHRTTRTRPSDEIPGRRAAYDEALRNVKRPRNARFRGLARAMVVFRRMRLRAALAVYAPGGAGFAAAAASFQAMAAGMLTAAAAAAAEPPGAV